MYRHLHWRLVVLLTVAVATASLAGAGDKEANPGKDISFGVKMAQRGLWGEALFRFREAAEARPGDPKILNNLAVALEAVGQFDDALATYQEALKAAPNNKELKRNYSRFLEFYQAFKPGEESAEEDSGPAATAAAEEGPSSTDGQ